MDPRPPTTSEKLELINLMILECGHDQDSIACIVENSAIAVFDNYITGCPGYVGKVMMVVWEAGPETHDVFTWPDGRISLEIRP